MSVNRAMVQTQGYAVEFLRVYTLFSARHESCEFRIDLKEVAFGHLRALLQPPAIKLGDPANGFILPLQFT